MHMVTGSRDNRARMWNVQTRVADRDKPFMFSRVN